MVNMQEQVDDQQQEESGWTSYLAAACPSSSLTHPLHSQDYHTCTSLTASFLTDLDNLEVVPPTHITPHFQLLHATAQQPAGNLHPLLLHQSVAPGLHDCSPSSMDIPDEESCGSSTVSSANSSLGSYSQRKHGFSSQKQPRSKRKRLSDPGLAATPPMMMMQTHLLEDTATSSPSEQVSECSRGDTCGLDEDGDVSKRFKALQALIPCLNEMVGKETEEDMLNAIISHVRALEQKVQLLSDVWLLTQVNHE